MLKGLLIALGLVASLATRVYQKDATVVFYDNSHLTVVAEDETGNLYAFDGYGFEPGQEVVLILDNNGTPTDREDDAILDVEIIEEEIK